MAGSPLIKADNKETAAINKLKEFEAEELAKLENDLRDVRTRKGRGARSDREYQQIYGFYWLLTDSLLRLETKENKEFIIKTKDKEFRKMHMEVKNWLWTQDPEMELSRKLVFPIYTDQLRLKKLNKELSRGSEEIGEAQYNEY